MIKQILLISMIVIMVLVAGGCAKKGAPSGGLEAVEDSRNSAVQTSAAPIADATGVQDVDAVSQDIQSVDSTTKDIDSSGIDNLDKDLENLDW